MQVRAGVKELFVPSQEELTTTMKSRGSADHADAVPSQVEKFTATDSAPAGHGAIDSRPPFQFGLANWSTSFYVTREFGAMSKYLDVAGIPTVILICVVFLSVCIYWRKTWILSGRSAAADTFEEHIEARQLFPIPHWQQQLVHFNVPFSSCVRKPR
jgi:hypothetical protein